MAPLRDQPERPGEAFGSAVRGHELAHLIQIHSEHQFTGCLSFHDGESTGLVFFRAGAVVHAELGGRSGEEALCDLLDWPQGYVKLLPGLTSTATSLQKPCKRLLQDVNCILEFRRASHNTERLPEAPEGPPEKALKASEIIEKVKGVPGVLYAVLQTMDGQRIGDASFEGEVLAGQGSFLAMVSTQLSPAFQAGDTLSAVVEGASRHLLLLGLKHHLLCVLASGEHPAGAVEAQIRQAFAVAR
ncbi:DUF4388 domain-containing protein [Geothrix sp. PMB-07]|uniref:DUF4388 domain-containing protein n=1 Tax=Geothrix sp. PMB-07 TaxID=3068640 RepID=UPI0027411AF9|nr:DUF4388 domain-containing protein [Geothrix sp. PMB-07]WLT32247.1 DUF4388 domain-containing protein [Geothrix sp. PMB-07]